MDKNQQPLQASNQTTPETPTQPAQDPTPVGPLPYRTGDGSYNRESGKKTLAFVGVIIALIAVLSVSSLLMINKKSSVMVQSETDRQTIPPVATSTVMPIASPTAAATSSEEAELDSINVEDSDKEIQSLEQDASQL